ncbi:PEP-CTERM sorting domain-containing protein [Hyphococcus formosus]|uniref:PEP-CTERM sorting domain-containing protein n=1 Tax=Hyphococcus formosus TaxID=3143534 RepID=UPI00398AF361
MFATSTQASTNALSGSAIPENPVGEMTNFETMTVASNSNDANGSNDDWLPVSIRAEQVADTPAPAVLPLLLAGIAGFAFASRKIKTL